MDGNRLVSGGKSKGFEPVMKTNSLRFFFVLAVSLMSCELAAQSDMAMATRKADLKTLSEQLKNRDVIEKQQARDYARRLGIPIRRELPNGKILELQRFSPGIGPSFYITNNVDAADTVSTDEVWPGGSAGLESRGNTPLSTKTAKPCSPRPCPGRAIAPRPVTIACPAPALPRIFSQ